MSKGEIIVIVDEEVLGINPLSSRIRCTIEEDGVGRFGVSLPPEASAADISQVLRHQAVFLEEDLPLNIPVDQRRRIIDLYNEAAEKVPSLEKGK